MAHDMVHESAQESAYAFSGVRRARPSVRAVAWGALAVAAVLALFPLRFTAFSTVAFEVGAEPPAVVTRGMAQLIASREMAHDALQKLDAADVARLSAGGTIAAATQDFRSSAARAAWRLMENIEVRPERGGRALEISVSAPSAALAARIANAYVSALLDLQASARAQAEAEAQGFALPVMRRGPSAALPMLPDPPRPVLVVVLLGALSALLITGRMRRRPILAGQVEADDLPRELEGDIRVQWLDAGDDRGLDAAAAVERLTALMPPSAPMGQVALVTSDDWPEASARCAVELARRLAEDARVALIALDGSAEELGALVSDPRAPGVSELLFGVAGFGETIHRDAHSRAHVIPPGRDARGGPGMVGAERLVLVLGALRQTYDHVVVAAPSLAGSRGAERLAQLDPLLVCIHGEETPATAAVQSYDAIAAHSFKRVAMLCLSARAFDPPAAVDDPDTLAPPSIDAQDQPQPPAGEPEAPRRKRKGRKAGQLPLPLAGAA
ncbi:hypothetical protein [Xanthobacter tagetidis]|uniref:Polysaccharide chain length determinant N-terminal domain-containing protein n=1 Tax=Xanthobacter tagetidis TaxID=60216 RepID=A0A3L7AFQ1_9HYPH|nr:hypothetical protein [Xanthobacter tagetidis]MBB6309749.1 hypothetical protein [Xanthobacter tagetidis]RLP78222.1 hypothetical protein D9R14_12620 [Xanthobacter tagetidis]